MLWWCVSFRLRLICRTRLKVIFPPFFLLFVHYQVPMTVVLGLTFLECALHLICKGSFPSLTTRKIRQNRGIKTDICEVYVSIFIHSIFTLVPFVCVCVWCLSFVFFRPSRYFCDPFYLKPHSSSSPLFRPLKYYYFTTYVLFIFDIYIYPDYCPEVLCPTFLTVFISFF